MFRIRAESKKSVINYFLALNAAERDIFSYHKLGSGGDVPLVELV